MIAGITVLDICDRQSRMLTCIINIFLPLDERAQFAGMLHGYSGNFLDPRGKLLPRASDILGR